MAGYAVQPVVERRNEVAGIAAIQHERAFHRNLHASQKASDRHDQPSGHGTWVYEAIQEGLGIPTPASRSWADAQPARVRRGITFSSAAARSSRRATCAVWPHRHSFSRCWRPSARGWPNTTTRPSI